MNYHDGAELLKIINNLKHSKTLTPEKYLKLIHHENALELSETILTLVNCGLYDEDLFEHLIQEAQPKLIACILNLLIKQNLYRPNYFFNTKE